MWLVKKTNTLIAERREDTYIIRLGVNIFGLNHKLNVNRIFTIWSG